MEQILSDFVEYCKSGNKSVVRVDEYILFKDGMTFCYGGFGYDISYFQSNIINIDCFSEEYSLSVVDWSKPINVNSRFPLDTNFIDKLKNAYEGFMIALWRGFDIEEYDILISEDGLYPRCSLGSLKPFLLEKAVMIHYHGSYFYTNCSNLKCVSSAYKIKIFQDVALQLCAGKVVVNNLGVPDEEIEQLSLAEIYKCYFAEKRTIKRAIP